MPWWRSELLIWPIDHLEHQFLPLKPTGKAVLKADQSRRMRGFPLCEIDYLSWHGNS
jgi:hypothetical protein